MPKSVPLMKAAFRPSKMVFRPMVKILQRFLPFLCSINQWPIPFFDHDNSPAPVSLPLFVKGMEKVKATHPVAFFIGLNRDALDLNDQPRYYGMQPFEVFCILKYEKSTVIIIYLRLSIARMQRHVQ
jgi:hypothetical protein